MARMKKPTANEERSRFWLCIWHWSLDNGLLEYSDKNREKLNKLTTPEKLIDWINSLKKGDQNHRDLLSRIQNPDRTGE